MDHQGSRIKEIFYGTVFYNYLFAAFQLTYNYFFRRMLLDRSMGAVYGSGKSLFLGTVILLAIAAGTYAILAKTRELRSGGAAPAGPTAFIVWVMNWVIVVMMVFTAVRSFGIDISKRSDMLTGTENAVLIGSILCAMAQAAFVIGFLARMSLPYEKSVDAWERLASDIFAFIFLCVAYTVVWETIVWKSVEVNGRYVINSGYGLFQLTGWALSFILLYPPMRFSFLLQEIHCFKQGRWRLRIAVSYAAVLVTGLIPLVQFR